MLHLCHYFTLLNITDLIRFLKAIKHKINDLIKKKNNGVVFLIEQSAEQHTG